jgi:hypothetical protein
MHASVEDSKERPGVIRGFIALFFVPMRVATTAKAPEALAVAAAYSAVLMVFVQTGTIGTHRSPETVERYGANGWFVYVGDIVVGTPNYFLSWKSIS